MPHDLDRHASERERLLAPVFERCQAAGVTAGIGHFEHRYGPPVRAVRSVAEDGSWDATVTIVRARPPDHPAHQQSRAGRAYSRDPRTGYDLESSGELVYEVQISEDDDGLGGHGPRPLVAFELYRTAEQAADSLILWARRSALFQCEVPTVDVAARQRRERRAHLLREAATAEPRVRIDVEPTLEPGIDADLAADLAAVDVSTLSGHFPREKSGRYQRTAVVALASNGGRPERRGRWLTARADGDGLVLALEDLIGVNQRHRWDVTPWLWDRRHAATPRRIRWQAQDPTEIAPILDAVVAGAMADALDRAGVDVDEQVGKLLTGTPTRSARAQLAATWVAALYTGLADLAPWRLAAAHQVWREERAARGLPARDPVTLFGLGGLGTARKPKIALDVVGNRPTLRLHYTGGSAVLPRSMWTIPADLLACRYGWPSALVPPPDPTTI